MTSKFLWTGILLGTVTYMITTAVVCRWEHYFIGAMIGLVASYTVFSTFIQATTTPEKDGNARRRQFKDELTRDGFIIAIYNMITLLVLMMGVYIVNSTLVYNDRGQKVKQGVIALIGKPLLASFVFSSGVGLALIPYKNQSDE